MNGFIKTGLCAVLIGASSVASSQSVKNTTPKNNLEVITEQNTFISLDGNYSLKRNPKVQGFTQIAHIVDPDNSYLDVYRDQNHRMLMINNIKESGDVHELYSVVMEGYILSLSETTPNMGAPDQSLYLKYITTEPKGIKVNNHPAIQSSLIYDIKDRNQNNQDIDLKFVDIITVVQREKDMFIITLFYHQFNDIEKNVDNAKINYFYDEIITSFHALK